MPRLLKSLLPILCVAFVGVPVFGLENGLVPRVAPGGEISPFGVRRQRNLQLEEGPRTRVLSLTSSPDSRASAHTELLSYAELAKDPLSALPPQFTICCTVSTPLYGSLYTLF